MLIKYMLDPGAKLPTRAHVADAGFDLYTPKSFNLSKTNSVVIDTGVHMEIPDGYYGLVTSKSGLNTKAGITSRGVIDSGYTGSIHVRLDMFDEGVYHFNEGDKIAQIIIQPCPHITLIEAKHLAGERGDNGFGSTGR